MIEGLFQPLHLIVILAIVLILFGPGKLPELGSALGKGIREFQRGTREIAEPAKEAPASSAAVGVAASSSAVCPKCGVAGQADHQYCANCGAPLTP